MTVPGDTTQRDTAIIERRRNGVMLREIAAEFGLSLGYVSKILEKHLPPDERRRLESEAHSNAQDAQHAELRAGRLTGLARCLCPACEDPDCQVKQGTCHHCGEPVQMAKSTRPYPRQVKGRPVKYCSRSCVGSAKRGRTWGSLSRELAATAGACGVPGCSPDCPVPPGHCHREDCDRPARTAESTNRSAPSVRGRPLRHCSLSCERLDNDVRCAKIAAKNRDREAKHQAALNVAGLVPISIAAELTSWSRFALAGSSRRTPKLTVVRRTFGSFTRCGADAREVLRLASDPHARGKLAKPLAVLNGTERVGRPLIVLSEDELMTIASLRSEDPQRWGWRSIAAALNEQRTPDDELSYMTVKRAFLRVAGV